MTALTVSGKRTQLPPLVEALRKVGEQLYGDFASPSLRLHHSRNRDERARYSTISRV